MAKYLFEHPAEAGLGEHHADPGAPPLEERSAVRHGAAGAPQHPAQDGELTMADLDMPHGTLVELHGHDEDRGLVQVDWVDKFGNDRRTSIDPGFFAEHFREVGT
jgi:hypothetical protein